MATSTIVGAETLPVLNKALTDLQTASNELELANRAGLFKNPTGPQYADLSQKIADAVTQITNIKQVYFPGQ